MSPYSGIAYIHIDGNECLWLGFGSRIYEEVPMTIPSHGPSVDILSPMKRVYVQVQLFKFLLKIKLSILHSTKFCNDIKCAIVWFKHILVFTHVDVIS